MDCAEAHEGCRGDAAARTSWSAKDGRRRLAGWGAQKSPVHLVSFCRHCSSGLDRRRWLFLGLWHMGVLGLIMVGRECGGGMVSRECGAVGER